KAMGFAESRLALLLGSFLTAFVHQHNLGIATGADGTFRLTPGLVRIPDLAFFSWDRLPDRRVPRTPIPDLAPDLAVEVLSPSNTKKEMERKLGEYFGAGVRLVWYVDPQARTVCVFTSPGDSRLLDANATLDGGDVLPGFQLPIGELFRES